MSIERLMSGDDFGWHRLPAILIAMLLGVLCVHGESVGLVLSGGGAKGIAHIGVIKALEDNDIPIDYITGTSMGAIIGGLYAAGFTPEEMLELIKSKDFADWSTGTINGDLEYYFDKKELSPAMFYLNLERTDSSTLKANILPSSLINPLPMNFAFMELFAPYTAQCGGDFDKLYVPFRCVAADVFNKRKLVLAKGSLGVAVRASMSFPLVFKPQYIDSIPIFDGGIYENFPVNVMKSEFSPDIIIGVDVTAGGTETDMDNIIKQIETMIVQDRDTDIKPEEGIRININLRDFQLLDFQKASQICARGYERAMSMMDSIKGRVEKRVSKEARSLSRSVFKSKTPGVAFGDVDVVGGSEGQNEYLRNLFNDGDDGVLDIEEAKIAFYRAISTGKLNDFVPVASYNKETGLFDLTLHAKMKDPISVGVGGWLSSSTNSMIYLSGNYCTLSYNSFDASLSGWLGQSYYAGMIESKIALGTNIPSYLKLTGVLSKQKFYENDVLFYKSEQPSFIINYEDYVKLEYGLAIGRKSKLGISIGYGYLKDLFYQSNVVDYSSTKQDKSTYKLGQIDAVLESNTLNHSMYPTSGARLRLKVAGVYGSCDYLPYNSETEGYTLSEGEPEAWVQAELQWDKYINVNNHFSLGIKADAAISSRPLGDNYTAWLVQAPSFTPTPATQNYFNPGFRSHSFIAGGILPIWKIVSNLQLRTEFYAFAHVRDVVETEDLRPEYAGWFKRLEWMGETALVYNFSFASLSLYCNYLTYPSNNWNFGISFGLLFDAPKFLR